MNTNNNNHQSWIDRLKEESWEAELLVSALAVFGTFQLFRLVEWMTNFFIDSLPMHQYHFGYMITFYALIAVSILSAMFVIHFSLRAYWVGLVGLNSVFPDYDFENSVFSPIYARKLVKILPKVPDTIQKVDQLCSVIFAAAFSVLFMLLYIVIFSTGYLLLFNLLSPYVHSWILLTPAVLLALLTLFQSILSIIANLKVFKHNEKIQHLYFGTVKLAWPLLNGPMNKNIMQVFMMFTTNFKKDKALSFLIIVFLIFGTSVSLGQIFKTNILYLVTADIYFDSTEVKSSVYASENQKNTNFSFLINPEIPSDIIKANYVRLFIPIYKSERSSQKQFCESLINLQNNDKPTRLQSQKAYLACYQEYNHIYLDDKPLLLEMTKYDHPITGQFGVLVYVPITEKQTGKYELTIKKQFKNRDEVIREWTLPFRI